MCATTAARRLARNPARTSRRKCIMGVPSFRRTRPRRLPYPKRAAPSSAPAPDLATDREQRQTPCDKKIKGRRPNPVSVNGFRPSSLRFATISGGEEEIRTLGTLLTYTRFPIVLLRPTRTPLRADLLLIGQSPALGKRFLRGKSGVAEKFSDGGKRAGPLDRGRAFG